MQKPVIIDKKLPRKISDAEQAPITRSGQGSRKTSDVADTVQKKGSRKTSDVNAAEPQPQPVVEEKAPEPKPVEEKADVVEEVKTKKEESKPAKKPKEKKSARG